MKKNIKIILILLILLPVLLLSGYEFLLFALTGFNTHYREIDRCLDSGGRWNYQTNQCEFKENTLISQRLLTCAYGSLVKTEDNPYGELQPYEKCAFVNSENEIQFKKEHFNNVNFEGDSLAPIVVKGYGHGYINKSGKIAIMHTFDNGPDYFKEGLARSIKSGKIGFVNRSLDIVIPHQFDAANPFQKGKAKVGINCQKVPDGGHYFWDCKEWYYIDKTGNRL